MTAAAIEAVGLAKRYGGFAALDGVDLHVPGGSYTVLLGPSGSGKTTLLSILGGFTTPDAGRVRVGGEDVTATAPAKRPTTTVFQDYALFPHMRVGANVAFGLKMRGVKPKERRERVLAMLGLVGLDGAEAKKPHELSGGQRQRVALARALAVEPAVLLLDEPLGALDLKLRQGMQEELKAIQERSGTTFVHVTHDQEEAMAIADRIVVLNRGRIEDEGPPRRVYLRPRTRFAADFMGQSCFVEGRVGRDGATIETKLGTLPYPPGEGAREAPGAPVTLTLRPEHLRPEPPGLDLGQAEVAGVAFLGAHARARLRHMSDPAFAPVILLPQDSGAAPGDVLRLHVRPEDITVLPGEDA